MLGHGALAGGHHLGGRHLQPRHPVPDRLPFQTAEDCVHDDDVRASPAPPIVARLHQVPARHPVRHFCGAGRYHPNVDEKGSICLDVLKEWIPACTIKKVLEDIKVRQPLPLLPIASSTKPKRRTATGARQQGGGRSGVGADRVNASLAGSLARAQQRPAASCRRGRAVQEQARCVHPVSSQLYE